MSQVNSNDDPWLEDTLPSTYTGSNMLTELVKIAEEEGITDEPAAGPVVVEPKIPVAPEAPSESEPKVVRNEDGSSISIEKTGKGWMATLDTGTGAKPEIFYGVTKEAVLINLATAKVHANKKIRDLNRQIKLGTAAKPAPTAPSIPQSPSAGRELSAEERLDLQVQMQADPAAALDSYLLKRYGLTPDKLVELDRKSNKGAAADRNLAMEEVARQFVAKFPDYHRDDENYHAVIGLIAKEKLGVFLTADNQDVTLNRLVDEGHYTVANLGEAFEELSEDGLLVFAPQVPAAPAPPEFAPVIPQTAVPPAPVPEVAPPAESNTVRRPRAGFGLRSSDASAPAPEANKLPSAEDFDTMTEEQLHQLMSGVRREARTRRF
jgi:hypothetical protein